MRTHVRTAWDVTRGDTGTIIGVIDTGIDLSHEDLSTQVSAALGCALDVGAPATAPWPVDHALWCSHRRAMRAALTAWRGF